MVYINNSQIKAVRENGDSTINGNQIKKVYIDNQGNGYKDGLGQEVSILGDGSGGRVVLDIVGSKITDAVVSSGGKGYSFGIVDLGTLNTGVNTAIRRCIFKINSNYTSRKRSWIRCIQRIRN